MKMKLLNAETILSEIKLPDYKGRHVFTAKLRLLIWGLSIFYYKGIWQTSPFIPISLSFAFLLTGICYNNILKGKALVLSFLLEIMADLFSMTTVVYMTGGEHSQFFTTYIIYAVAAGTFYSNSIAMLSAGLSLIFYLGLLLLLYFGILEPFKYPSQTGFFLSNSKMNFFMNFSLVAIFLPIVVYAAKIANDFSSIKEKALEDRNKQLIALNRISSTIKGFLSMEKAIRRVLGGVIDGLGYEVCFLVVLSKKENAIVFYAPRNNPTAQKIEQLLGRPISDFRLPGLALRLLPSA